MATCITISFCSITVLQECATDSEDLIYPMRASSTCSAPPDLLLTGDREPLDGNRMSSHCIPKDVNITTKTQSADGGCGGGLTDTKRMLLEVIILKNIVKL